MPYNDKMARVWTEGADRISVRISIADPLQLLSLLCGGVLGLSVLGWIGFLASIFSFTVHVPPHQKLLGVTMLSGMVAVFGFGTAFGLAQVWRFDRQSGRIDVLRAGIVVRSETMVGLERLELKEIDDDDGGAARALLVYSDHRTIALNRTNTGSIRELASLVDAVNQFLQDGR